MRLSVNPEDTVAYGAWRVSIGKGIRVFLDDVEQTRCTVADDEEGYIVRCVTDDEGNLVLNGEYIQYERVNGNVRIEIGDL